MPSVTSVAIVGAGFSGTLFALKLAAARPDWAIQLVDQGPAPGRGLAYGACSPQHLLNVPVSRMEIGLKPAFMDWLADKPLHAVLADGGALADAFVPRQWFGDYLEEQLAEALAAGRIQFIKGAAVSVAPRPRAVHLADGRVLAADIIVLALGNRPGTPPFRAAACARVIVDPWASGALQAINKEASVVLVGSGLTMVDTALSLQAQGHRGPLHALSRHGLLPGSHQGGGSYPSFAQAGLSPLKTLQGVRAAVREAQAKGTPWQRVFDAVRPMVARIWDGWSVTERRQFLRHLRTIWDVHRHRMAGRIAGALDQLTKGGQLKASAGRILAVDATDDGVTLFFRPRGGKAQLVEADAVVVCTGPLMDLRKSADPILQGLFRDGLVTADALGLGLETLDCAVRD